MEAHKAVYDAHMELLDGLRSISTGSAAHSDGSLLVELRQSFGVGVEDGGARPVLGSMQTQTFNTGGLGENKVVRVLLVDMFFPALQQHHTRLLALVEAERTLMPHLLVEVAENPSLHVHRREYLAPSAAS